MRVPSDPVVFLRQAHDELAETSTRSREQFKRAADLIEAIANNVGDLTTAIEELDQQADYWRSRAASVAGGFSDDAVLARQCERGAAILRAVEGSA